MTTNATIIAANLAKVMKAIPGVKISRRRGRITVTPADAVPLQHQAKSSGALGTPERNHDCPECDGSGRASVEVAPWTYELHPMPCPHCDGSGELTANGLPGERPSADRRIRQTLTRKRDAGKIGRKP